MAQVTYLDNLLKEYLIFRGFSQTLKTLDQEQKNEKDQSFRSEKIVEQFNHFVHIHDLQSLRSLWSHLDSNLFSKFEHTFASAVKKLENSLWKYYLVVAATNSRQDKITEFFTKMASELQQQSEWKEWFYFPFCKNPEESPIFAMYFTKQWQDTLLISLRNFLATVYQCLPQPTFVRAEQEAAYIRRLQEENSLLKARLQSIQQQGPQPFATAGEAAQASTSTYNRRQSTNRMQQNLNDILPFDVSPPGHVLDDFCIIASEANNVTQASEQQARGLKMLIRQIGSGGGGGGSSNSPVMGRKDSSADNRTNKRRSGSVGRNWI